jgi:hypothetical protein
MVKAAVVEATSPTNLRRLMGPSLGIGSLSGVDWTRRE